jgi:hypothetical protein
VLSSEFSREGFTILPGVLSTHDCAELISEVAVAINAEQGDAIKAGQGRVVGGRNLIDHWSGWQALIKKTVVRDFVHEQLGTAAGLVRILYFDKPPGQSWSLSLHRDRTIAVAEHHQPPAPFAKPTVKAGVPHVEASEQLLQRMLTLRLHLDPMNDQNGPLVVIPGSHANSSARPEAGEIMTIHCNAGDVFVMRPLLSHGSRAAQANTTLHRRVLHLELAADEQLPAPYHWHHFESIDA